MRRVAAFLAVLFAMCAAIPVAVHASAPAACWRPDAGAVAVQPPELRADHGTLKLALNYQTSLDAAGRTLFCFTTPAGDEAPTLRVRPGDNLDITLHNQIPSLPPGAAFETVSNATDICGDAEMTAASVNIHFHGTNTAPVCHGDEVVHTLVGSGETFHYNVHFPLNEPPGLFWYHPHVHGIAEAAVLGGASGGIVVSGMPAIQPAVANLPQRILIVRDQTVAAAPVRGQRVPAWDLSLNYVPISYPTYTPAVLEMRPGVREFWRVLNAAADTILDLQLLYDGQAQIVQVVGLDGVPTGSQDGGRTGTLVPTSHLLLPPGARAEFIVTGPAAGVATAALVTRHIDTGPDGDFDPDRTLAMLRPVPSPMQPMSVEAMQEASGAGWAQRFEGLQTTHPSANRTLYFSEVLSDPNNPASPTDFFITVDGAMPVLFSPNNPPAITTHQGAVEDWTIENRSGENHEFHIHQIHFLVLKRNGVAVDAVERQMHDMIQVPYWNGSGPYPSVTVRMDFRGPDVGDFVYHCHILGHEDNGMMAIIRVLPKRSS